MESKVYTLSELSEANLIVRNEYSDLLSEMRGIITNLQSELSDAKERIRNLEKTAHYTGREGSMPTEAPKGFKPLDGITTKKLRVMLLEAQNNGDSGISFIQSVLDQGSTSEKQREILNKIHKRLSGK